MNATNDRGRTATSPWALPWSGWRDVLVRTWAESGTDNIGLVASGVAFYAFLALVPLLGATVLSYGLIAAPATVIRDMQALTAVMPADAARLIGEQLLNVVQASEGKKGFGLLLALGIAFYGAMKAASAILIALNIAYEQVETRGFIKLNLMALAITVIAVLTVVIAMIAIAAMGHLEALFPAAPGFVLVAGKLLSYALMAAVGAVAAATLYRYGPDRDQAKWVWLSPGSIAATLLWLALTLGFGIYVANFGNYNATYGSLGAVMVLLTWFYLSAWILLMGAELNAELEHQTVRDTTRGPDVPMGARGAHVADTVAGEPEEGNGKRASALSDAQAPDAGPSAVSRTVRITAATVAGPLPSMLVLSGLALVRRRGSVAGLALLGLGAALAWQRAPDRTTDGS